MRLSGVMACFRFHQVREDVINACQMAWTLGLQPFEHLRFKTNADRNFRMPFAEADHAGQLLIGHIGYLAVIRRRLFPRDALERGAVTGTKRFAPDSGGCGSYQLFGPR